MIITMNESLNQTTFPFERVLVTGGAGFIGAHLVKALTAIGAKVNVLELPGVDVSTIADDNVTVIRGDICDNESVARAIESCDAVYHLAANPNLWAKNPEIFNQVNYLGTCCVISEAAKAGVKKIIHVSTESILLPKKGTHACVTETTKTDLADMIGPYCRSKWMAEAKALEASNDGLPVIIVNPTVPVGPGDRHHGPISRLINDFEKGKIKAYMEGMINFIDVRDIASGIIKASLVGQPGRRYLLGNENWTIQSFFALLSELTSQSTPKFKVPFAIALGFAWCEEIACNLLPIGEPMATVTGIHLSNRSIPFDASSTISELGLNLSSCQHAITEMVDWLHKTEPKR